MLRPVIIPISRIKRLEYQVGSIQTTLADLVTAIKSSTASAVNNNSPQSYYPSPSSSGNYNGFRMPPSNMYQGVFTHEDPTQAGAMIPNLNAFGGHQAHSTPIFPHPSQPNQARAPGQQFSPMPNQSFDTSNTRGSQSSQRASSRPLDVTEAANRGMRGLTDCEPTNALGFNDFRSDVGAVDSSGKLSFYTALKYDPGEPGGSQPGFADPGQPSHPSEYVTNTTTPYGSDGEEDDPLAPARIVAPLNNMSSMAGLAEAAVERAKAEKLAQSKESARVPGGVGPSGNPRSPNMIDDFRNAQDSNATITGPHGLGRMDPPSNPQGDDRGTKRRRTDVTFVTPKDPNLQHFETSSFSHPPGIIIEAHRSSKGKKTRKHVHAFPDVVSLGLVSEEEGRMLFDLYFEGSNAFLPLFDLCHDNWDSLRLRSPFITSAIIAVGARVRDGGGPVSETQRVATEHARKIGLGTMWTPVARIEAVQASLILAAFSQNGWLPSGHAVRLGLDMEINHSFTKLLKGGMGAGKTPEELEEERDLVIQARCWFALYMVEHQMSYGSGRPAILREDMSIAECRRFLDHPLSIVSDVRLISTVEMIALRAPLHIVLTSSPEEPLNQEAISRLQQANRDFDMWLGYWSNVMVDRFKLPQNDFFLESLRAQRSYASLFTNSQLLRGVEDTAAVRKMPTEKRELALEAMMNAQSCLEIVIRSDHYRAGLKYGMLRCDSRQYSEVS